MRSLIKKLFLILERRIMGDEIALSNAVRLSALEPNRVRFVLLRNGGKSQEFSDVSEFSINVSEPGTYCVEVYLDQLGSPFDKAPWIMSNPIYVR